MRELLACLAMILAAACIIAAAARAEPYPSALAVLSASERTVTVQWSAAEGATGYALYKDGAKVATAGAAATKAKFGVNYGTHTLGVAALPGGKPATITVTNAWKSTAVTYPEPAPPIQPPDPQPSGAQVFMSALTGNDATCTRLDPNRPCFSYVRALQVANAGDSVQVAPGTYTYDSSFNAYGVNLSFYQDGAGVTFRCVPGSARDSVTTGNSTLLFAPGAANISFVGSCFYFHLVTAGLGGYSTVIHDITFDGGHMDGFNLIGTQNVTLRNEEVGPWVACYGPSATPAYARCDPNSADPLERYWASLGDNVNNLQQEPFIHSGASGVNTNTTLDHVHIHGISSKWSGTHTGGLLIWDTKNLTIKDSVFDQNAIYDIEFNATSNDDGYQLLRTYLHYPVYSQDPTEPKGQLPVSYKEGLGVGTVAPATESNWLIQGNTADHGWITYDHGTVFQNITVQNNGMGAQPECGAPHAGLKFAGGNTACDP